MYPLATAIAGLKRFIATALFVRAVVVVNVPSEPSAFILEYITVLLAFPGDPLLPPITYTNPFEPVVAAPSLAAVRVLALKLHG